MTDRRQTQPLWATMAGVMIHSDLPDDLYADVCVVGAGIAGMTTAYLLSQQGRSVIVLDQGSTGQGETDRTIAHVSNVEESGYLEIERLHGEEGAWLAADSHTAAIDLMERIVSDEGIACDFERLGGYVLAPAETERDAWDMEWDAARRAGVPGVTRFAQTPFSGFPAGPCLYFPRQAQFNPLQYLAGLAQALKRDGGLIYAGACVDSIEDGSRVHVHTKSGRVVTADAVVVTTGTPHNNLSVIPSQLFAHHAYGVGVSVPHTKAPHGLFWDTLNPQHRVRLAHFGASEGHDLLIVWGDEQEAGTSPRESDPYARLEAWAKERFPMMHSVEARWSGQVVESRDGLALIGKEPGEKSHVFVAIGEGGMGVTHGVIAAVTLSDLIAGRGNPWAALYDPSRATADINRNGNVLTRYANS